MHRPSGERSRASPNGGGNGRTTRSRLCRAPSSPRESVSRQSSVSKWSSWSVICVRAGPLSPSRPSLSFSLPVLYAPLPSSVPLSLSLFFYALRFISPRRYRRTRFVARDPFRDRVYPDLPVSPLRYSRDTRTRQYTYRERVPQCGVVTSGERAKI